MESIIAVIQLAPIVWQIGSMLFLMYGASAVKSFFEQNAGHKLKESEFKLAMQQMQSQNQAAIRTGMEKDKSAVETMGMARDLMSGTRADKDRALQLQMNQNSMERTKDLMGFAMTNRPKPYFGHPLSPEQIMQYMG
jgi:hypothetical protein